MKARGGHIGHTRGPGVRLLRCYEPPRRSSEALDLAAGFAGFAGFVAGPGPVGGAAQIAAGTAVPGMVKAMAAFAAAFAAAAAAGPPLSEALSLCCSRPTAHKQLNRG